MNDEVAARAPGVRRRGVVYILALVLLVLSTTIAVSFSAATDMNHKRSDNARRADEARLAAESGLSFMLYSLKAVRLPGDTTQADFADELATALGSRLNGTPNLAGQTVTHTSTSVSIPTITVGGRTFSAAFTWAGAERLRMEITGRSGQYSRRIVMDLAMTLARPAVFDYGLASRGQVSVFGNAQITGVNNMAEASVLSTTTSSPQAITVGGSSVITGDLSAAGADTTIVITGSPTIAGSQDPSVIAQHVHLGVEAPDFPALQTQPLAALATDTINASTDLSGQNLVFNNVRIAAGTNPTFNHDVTLNGVIYVEAPNIVRFEGHSTIRGLIVTQATTQPLESCQLHFAGNVEAYGVETLPNEPQFSSVRGKTGTFVVAPGFGVTFAGNFSAINGTIAADQLNFTGTAEGIVKGSVLGLRDMLTSVGGNVQISVDRSGVQQNPAGFLKSYALSPQAGSYVESGGG